MRVNNESNRYFAHDTLRDECIGKNDTEKTRLRITFPFGCARTFLISLVAGKTQRKLWSIVEMKKLQRNLFCCIFHNCFICTIFRFLLWLKQCWVCKYEWWRDVGEFSLESWSLRRRLLVMSLSSVRRLPAKSFINLICMILHLLSAFFALSSVIEKPFQRVITELSGRGSAGMWALSQKSNTEKKLSSDDVTEKERQFVASRVGMKSKENFPGSVYE